MSIICPTRLDARTGGGSPPAPRGGVGDAQLEAVSYHLQTALQLIRDLPAAPLAREEFYTWVYHLVSAALTLVVTDSRDNSRVITKAAPPENPALAGDLDLIR